MFQYKYLGALRRVSRPVMVGLQALCCLLWLLVAPSAQAACSSPQTMSVPFNGQATLDLFYCSAFGFNAMPVSPSHGTVVNMTVAGGQDSAEITYQHNGDSATSDTFTVVDDSFTNIVVNVTIAAQATPLTIAPASVTNPSLGTPYSQTITTSGGTGPYTYAQASGTMPAGLSINSAGVISGTPTGTGTFTFSIKSTDSTSPTPYTATKSYSFTVAIPQITVTTASLPNGMVSVAYSNPQLAASGGTAPYTWSRNSGSYPPGLTLSTGGVLSGTPTTAGTYTVSILATDSTSGAGPYYNAKSFTIVIDPLPAPPVAGATSAAVGYGAGATSVPLVLSGGAATSVAVLGAASHGTAVASGTTITYTPTPGYAGTDSFTYTASNAGGTSSAATASITVSAPTLGLSPAGGTLTATVPTAYSQTFTASGGSGTYTYAQSGTLPVGLSFNTATGVLSGAPTQAGSFPISVAATDHSTGVGPFSVTSGYTLTVTSATVTLSPAVLATQPEVGVAYSQQFGASGGVTPYSYTVSSGATPSGLTLSSGGLLAGTPTTSGAYSFSVSATDSSYGSPVTAVRSYSGTVGAGAPVATASSATVAYGSSANAITLTLSGGTATSVAVVGAASHGTATASGATISYTPAAGYGGSDSFTYNATNAVGTSATVTVTVTVTAPTLTLTPTALTTQPQVGVAYSQQMSTSGGLGPYTYAVTSNSTPAGLTLSSSGLLSGTPTAAGAYNFTVTATDSSVSPGYTAVRTYSGTVGAGAPVAAASSATVAYGSSANAITLSLSGGAASSVAVVGAAAHGTATASGVSITYTPTVGYGGSDSFTYNATNAVGTSATVTVTVTVTAPTLTLTPTALTTQPQVGVAYSQQMSTSGGLGPYTYAVSSNATPAGLTLSSSGLLSGTPTAAGAYNFTVTATDSSVSPGYTAVRTYSGTVGAGAPVAAASSATVAYGSSANAITLSLSGGTPTSVSVVGAASHGTATASGATISYTPAVGYGGSDSFSYNATNAIGTSGTVTVTITVSAPTLALSPSALTQPQLNVAYSQQLSTSGGLGPYAYAVTGGTLPAGLNLSAAGLITGTPTTVAAYSFTVTATDSSVSPGYTATHVYSGNIGAGAPVVAATTATVAFGSSANAITLSLSGGTPTSVTVVGAASHGTATANGAAITYTPTAGYAGTDTFTFSATNAIGTSGIATATITVSTPTLAMTPATLTQPEVGSVYSQQLSTTGGFGIYTYAVTSGTAPAGLTVSAAGLISGTPTTAGAYSFIVTATDSSLTPYSVPRTYSGSVGAGAPVAAASSATVAFGSSANAITLSLSGGTPVSVTLVGAAAHGTASASGAAISYTPTAGYAGTDSFTYNATNAIGTSVTVTVTITVTVPTLALSPATITQPQFGSAYSQQLTTAGGYGPYTYAVTGGTLPAGLSLSTAGLLTGTPTSASAYSFTVTATDSSIAPGYTATKTYSGNVGAGIPTATASSATVAFGSSANAITLSLSGGTATSVTVVGAAAHGTASASGAAISYTPAAGYAGADSFTYNATNTYGTSGTVTVTITVSAPVLVLSPATITAPTSGTVYSQQLSTSGGLAPYTYAVTSGTLPAGLTISAAGLIGGTPTTTANYSFTVTATDSSTAPGFSVARAYSGSVSAAAPSLAAPVAAASSATVAYGSSANAISLSLSGGAAASVTLSAAPAHGAVVVSGTSISYTPTAGYSGPDAFSYYAVNSTGNSATVTVTITVSAAPLALTTTSITQPRQGVVYSLQLSATGGTAPYTYSLSAGALPAGLSLSSSGLLSGTPTTTAAYSFTVAVSDSAAVTAKVTQAYSGTISAGPPVAAASSASVAYGSQAQAVTLNLSGAAALSVAVVGAPAHGSAVASGTAIRYTPTVGYSGADSFSYNASNAAGTSATVTVSVTVAAPALSLAASAPWTATVGTAYTQNLTWSGGAAPYTAPGTSGWPTGLAMTVTSGTVLTISGTPTQTGNFTVQVWATDSSTGAGAPFTKSQSFTLVVSAAVPTATVHSASIGAGASADVDLMTGALNGPFTGAAVVGVNPTTAGTAAITNTGTTAAPAYHLNFTAAKGYSGTAQIGYTLSNAAGVSPTAMVNIVVAARTDVASDPQVKALATAQNDTVKRFNTAQLSNFTRRLEGLHGDGWATSSFGLTLVPVLPTLRQQASQWQDGDFNRTLYRSPLQASLRKVGWGQQDQSQTPTASSVQATDGSRNRSAAVRDGGSAGSTLPDLPNKAEARQQLSLWVDGSIDFGQRNARGEQQGFRFTSNGISTGGDYRFSEKLTLGAGVGFSRENSDIGDDGSKNKATGASVSIYGSVRPTRNVFIDGLLGYGSLHFDMTRYVTGDGSYATSTRGGSQVFGSISSGYEYRGDTWLLSPYGRLELASTTLDQTSETASSNNALTYFKQTGHTSGAVLGLRSEGRFVRSGGVWSPRMRIEYKRQFSGADDTGVAYADLASNGPSYMLHTDAQTIGTWTAGLGVRVLMSNGVSVLVDYNSNLNIGQGHYRSILFGVAWPFN